MKTTIVMVVYQQQLEQSKTFQTMVATLFQNEELMKDKQIIIYDNSKEPQTVPNQYKHFVQYKHDARNLGIATAYNFAWRAAKEHESKWLLLLDHDTELTAAYVEAIFAVDQVDQTKIAAVVPKIMCNDVMISPIFSGALQPLKEQRPEVGVQELPVMAINSASLISMSFLERTGGFNEEFPLDFLDHWLFYQMYELDYQVLVIKATLEHELSVMNYDTVSLQRYKSILGSEIHFYKTYKTSMLKRYRVQLFLRTAKQLMFVKNKRIALHTLRQLLTV